MNTNESFSVSKCLEQAQLAERELSAFVGAVAQLYGPEQARLSAEDWLQEAALIDTPPRSTSRDWRNVTIAASARLASRVNAAVHRENWFESGSVQATRLTDTKVQLFSSEPSDVILSFPPM